MPDPHFTALDAQLADAHEEARRLALEVERLREENARLSAELTSARYERVLALRKALAEACDLIDEEVPSAGTPRDQARFAEWRRLAEGK